MSKLKLLTLLKQLSKELASDDGAQAGLNDSRTLRESATHIGLFFGFFTGAALAQMDPAFSASLLDEFRGNWIDSPALFWVRLAKYVARLQALAEDSGSEPSNG